MKRLAIKFVYIGFDIYPAAGEGVSLLHLERNQSGDGHQGFADA